MNIGGIVLSLAMGLVTMVTADNPEFRRPPLPIFTSVEVSTSNDSNGSRITLEYLAPEKPFALWYVNGLPIREGRMDYMAVNDFEERGITIMSALHDKFSRFAVCLHNVDGEICLTLKPLPTSAVVREKLEFPWPLMTPGPVARYRLGKKVRIHAPVMETQHNYNYSAMFYSKNPGDPHGRLVTARTHGMMRGLYGDVVTIGPVSRGSGWMLEVRTDQAGYEGVLLVNTSYIPHSGLVQSCFLIRPFSIYNILNSSPFSPGFVTPIPNPITWRCRRHVDCMVVCPFLSNGHVHVTISRLNPGIASVLNEGLLPATNDIEEEDAVTRMLGPYMGYGAIFIPDFVAERDAGTYRCMYTTENAAVGVISLVEVN